MRFVEVQDEKKKRKKKEMLVLMMSVARIVTNIKRSCGNAQDFLRLDGRKINHIHEILEAHI